MHAEWRERPATAADYPHYLRLLPELGVDDPAPTEERWERDMVPRSLFLEAQGEPIAYGLWAIYESIVYVQNVIVDPGWRGRRVGRALMAAIAARILDAGYARWCLNVKIDNTPAIRLYERCGLARHHASTYLELAWDRVAALPREASDVLVRPIEPAEEAALEEAFHQPAGRIKHLRTVASRVFFRLVDPAHPEEARVGIIGFDPSFPGAPLFGAVRPALVTPLLDAIRPHARPGDASLKLMVEGDPALAAVLHAAGAKVRLELLHMCGEIPRPITPAAPPL